MRAFIVAKLQPQYMPPHPLERELPLWIRRVLSKPYGPFFSHKRFPLDAIATQILK